MAMSHHTAGNCCCLRKLAILDTTRPYAVFIFCPVTIERHFASAMLAVSTDNRYTQFCLARCSVARTTHALPSNSCKTLTDRTFVDDSHNWVTHETHGSTLLQLLPAKEADDSEEVKQRMG